MKIEYDPDTGMGEIAPFFDTVNRKRIAHGLGIVPHRNWIVSRPVRELRELIRRRTGKDPFDLRKGNATSHADVRLLIRAAIDLDPEIALDIIEAVLRGADKNSGRQGS